MHAVIKRTAVLIEQAKRAGARSYMVRFKAMSAAGWTLFRRDPASLRQAPAAEGKKRQVERG